MANATQSEEARAAALAHAPSHTATATGQALQKEKEDERLENHPRGSTIEIEGGPTSGDFGGGEPQEPRGLQAEPAAFTASGTIPPAMVSSPGGFVPLSAVPEGEREERLQTTLGKTSRGDDGRALTEAEVDALDGPSIRAIGHQRGYHMPEQAGSRRMRQVFLTNQAEDPVLKDEKKGLRKLLGK